MDIFYYNTPIYKEILLKFPQSTEKYYDKRTPFHLRRRAEAVQHAFERRSARLVIARLKNGFYVDLSRAIWRSSGTPQHSMASKMGLTCCYWCFHVLSNTSIWWDWEKKFPSKWMRWFSLQVLCRFWIFLCIFIFLSPNFNVSYSLINVWPLTRTYTFVNHVWWVGISSFKF